MFSLLGLANSRKVSVVHLDVCCQPQSLFGVRTRIGRPNGPIRARQFPAFPRTVSTALRDGQKLQDYDLRDYGLRLVGIAALLRVGIDGRGHVVIGGTTGHRAVGVADTRVQRRI